jgi:2-polyprenyl-3-methyl-5-hydroxy-6-metoxy-1,4-benzoquinol methylase
MNAATDVERFHDPEGADTIELVMHFHRYRIAAAWAGGRRVLDVGCGDGYGASLLAGVAASVLGIERDETTVAAARAKYAAANLRFAGDALESLPAGGFDLITCFEVVEHVDESEQQRFVAEFARLLAPGGVLLASTPNHEVKERQYARFPDWQNPFHVRELTRDEWTALLAERFAHVAIVPQAVEVASVVGVPVAGVLRVPEQAAWVNVACASQEPLAWPAAEEVAFLPRRMELLEQLLASERGKQEELVRGERLREQLLVEVDRVTAELTATRAELARVYDEHARLQRDYDLLEQSLGHRVSLMFDRFPLTKRLIIRAGNLLTGR